MVDLDIGEAEATMDTSLHARVEFISARIIRIAARNRLSAPPVLRRIIFCDEIFRGLVILIGRDSMSLAVVICDLCPRLDATVRLQCSAFCVAKSCEMVL